MTAGVFGLILLILILLAIPSVQTFLAKKATNFLSKQMQTEVSIDKLRIDFRLNVAFENLHLNDQRGNNLISAQKGRAGLAALRLTKKGMNMQIRPVVLDNADVCLRRYAGDSTLNIQFFIDFVKPKEKNDKTAVVKLQKVELKNSRFQCRMDDSWEEDEQGVWNYADIRLSDINLKMNQLLIVGDSLTFQIDHLSAREHSGFQLDSLKGQLIIHRKGLYCLNTHLLTENKSNLFLDFRFEYSDFSDFGDVLNAVSFNSEIHEGVFNLKDLGYFVGKMQGMKTMVDVKTTVSGPVSDLKLKNTQLSFGQGTEFQGDVALTGLPTIAETFIDLTIKDLKTTIADLAAFDLPLQQKIPLPDKVQSLQWVRLWGHFIGLYDNFFSDMQLSTALGSGSCELMLNARAKPMSYDGKLEVEGLHLGNLLNNKDLGLISAKTQIKGKGLEIKDMDFGVDATVFAIEYKEHKVENILLTGNFLSKQFNGVIISEDTDLDLDFNGNIDFNQEKPIYNFDLDVKAINLSNFRLLRPDSNVVVSAKIKTDLMGNNLDSMQGSLSVENFVYTENGNRFFLPKIDLIIRQLGEKKQHISLLSDVLDVDVKGEFAYKYVIAKLQKQIQPQLSHLVPYTAIPDSTAFPQKIDMQLEMKKNIPLLVHFFPMVAAPNGLTAKLSMNEEDNTLFFDLKTPQLTVKDYLIDNIQVNANQQADAINVDVDSDGYRFKKTDSLADIQVFRLRSSIQNNVIAFSANAAGNDKNKVESLRFEGKVGFEAKNELWVDLKRGIINWNANTFVFDTLNYAYITPRNIYVENFGLRSRDRQKSIHVRSASNNKDDNNLLFDFNKIDLGMFNMILNPFQISLEGLATGSGKVVLTPDGFGIGSSFQMEDLGFNEVHLGFLEGNTVWLNQEKKLYIGATLYETPDKSNTSLLSVKGHFDPVNKFINMDGDINDFNIKILEKYLQSFASKIEGFGTGHLNFSGKIAEPELTGELLLRNAVMGIAFLNTEYKIDEGKLRFVDTGFVFDNVPVRDLHNGRGFVNGMVTHKRLQNWGLDLRIRADNMMGMNTTARDNSLFYGKAFATGTVTIGGMVDDLISIGIDVTTNPHTDIILSLDWATTAVESNFVTFVSRNKEDEAAVSDAEILKSNLAVKLKITATPDAVVRVLLDPSIGGSIVGRGNSIMEISLDENDKFSIFGKYTLVSGDFNLTYADLLTRRFRLENGSTLTWNGDPMEGIIDIRAIQNARVSTRLPHTGQSITTTVNNIIKLSGNILNPNFSFTFNLPDVDEFTRSFIYNDVDTTNREEMIKQMVNILFFGQISSSDSRMGTSAINSGIGHSLSELVSYQINRVISGIVPNVETHIIYQSGAEEESRKQYGTEIKGNFFNDRLTVTTNLGVMESTEHEGNNQFLGDLLVEFKLNRDGSFKVKGFNFTNQQDLLLHNSRYSQGVGLAYSRDFDRFRDMFMRKKKRNKRQQK